MRKLPDYPEVFCDLNPPLGKTEAEIESSRCYYCYDAPCIQACPTSIDIPSFIRKIGNGNVRGAAMDILSANIMGGTCARVCPVETLCQEACVREKADGRPVEIGRLQRYATDEFFRTGEQPFIRAPSKGMKVAVVGAGPAGLSCAHQLARAGYDVVIFEARPKAGGLNEFGIAPYKMVDGFAQKEVNFILSIGGIEVRRNQKLGRDFTLDQLRQEFSAVFLGIGLGGNRRLNIPGEDTPGVEDATWFIEKVRQAQDLSTLEVGRHVVVIGGGNTAVDVAVQAKRLGAEFVTLVYRRGTDQMGATWHEQEIAQKNGVLIKTWGSPSVIHKVDGKLNCVEFDYTALDETGKLVKTGQTFTLPADRIFKAIGQKLQSEALQVGASPLEINRGRILVDERFETSVPGIFAGGDCVEAGEDLTVTSVQQGKLAALAIHERLSGARGASTITFGLKLAATTTAGGPDHG